MLCEGGSVPRREKWGKRKQIFTYFYICFLFHFFFWLLQKKKKRDDEHAGFLFLIMQGTSLLCFLIFFRLYDTQVYQKERETADYIYLCLPSPKYSLCNSASFFFFSSSPSHVSVAFSFSVFHRRLLCGH